MTLITKRKYIRITCSIIYKLNKYNTHIFQWKALSRLIMTGLYCSADTRAVRLFEEGLFLPVLL